MSSALPAQSSESVRLKLTPSELAANLKICFAARRSVMVHGDPGIGKSQIVQQVADAMFARKYDFDYTGGVVRPVVVTKKGSNVLGEPLGPSDPRPWFRDIRAALLDAVDLRGLPMVEDGKAKWAIPDFLPTDPRGGVVFFDEINRGSEMTMNGLFSLAIPPHTLGEFHLNPAWIPASAVNDQDVGARRMSSALLARFIHLELGGTPDAKWLDDVCKLAVTRDWHPMVIAFLRSFTKMLHQYDPKARVSPNPRGWEFVSDVMKQDPSPTQLFSLVAGQVGEAAAREFCAFAALFRKLPSLDNILTNPKTADVPSNPSVMYAIVATLARRATTKNFTQVLTYLDRVPVEFNVACVVDAVRRTNELQYEPAYTKWAIAHGEVGL
ncbi:MAG: hypothetical protein KGL39_22350 [Patescibacteria group bacterium]|nr:hypothetical protein [Patescibacteria group bacterium]